MQKSLAAAAAAAMLAVLAPPSSAVGVVTPVTYTNLVWGASFTAAGLTTCDQLVFDGTGDFAGSGALVLYGALNCASGAYGMTGSMYTAVDGSFSITMLIAGYTIACPRVASFSGNCTIYDSGGVVRGSGVINLL